MMRPGYRVPCAPPPTPSPPPVRSAALDGLEAEIVLTILVLTVNVTVSLTGFSWSKGALITPDLLPSLAVTSFWTPWASPQYQIPSAVVATPVYVGCYADTLASSGGARAILNAQALSSGDAAKNTPARCANFAATAGNAVFGVQNGNQCFHSNDLGAATFQGVSSTCSVNCTGDASLKCGGVSQNSVYVMPTYVGCYVDSTTRAMGTLLSVSSNSLAACGAAAAAAGFSVFGMQAGTQCYASNDLAAATAQGPSTACIAACPGSGTETCGGSWANTVYTIIGTSPVTTGMVPILPSGDLYLQGSFTGTLGLGVKGCSVTITGDGLFYVNTLRRRVVTQLSASPSVIFGPITLDLAPVYTGTYTLEASQGRLLLRASVSQVAKGLAPVILAISIIKSAMSSQCVPGGGGGVESVGVGRGCGDGGGGGGGTHSPRFGPFSLCNYAGSALRGALCVAIHRRLCPPIFGTVSQRSQT